MSNYSLPSNWKLEKIKNFAHTTSGGTPKRSFSEYFDGDIPWVKSGDLNDGLLSSCEETITELGLKNSSAKLFKEGTLLIALYGATIGRLSILNFEAATNQAVCGISVPDSVNVKYLFYYLLSIRRNLIEKGKGGAQPNINQYIVNDIEVPIAPPDLQKQIVAKIEELFSHIDAGVVALQKAKQLLKQYRQSVLKAAVTGELTKEWREQNKDKLEPASELLKRILDERRRKWEDQQLELFKAQGKVPKDDKWKAKYKEPIFLNFESQSEIPESWNWVAWDFILDFKDGSFKRGPFGSALKKEIFVDAGYKVYEQYCPINDDCSYARYYISEEKFKELNGFSVEAGDFLISCSGVTLGRITQVPNEYEKGVINQALLRVRINKSIIDDSYFKMLFRSPFFQKQIFDNVAGVAIPNVKGVKELKSIPLPLPPKDEQIEIFKIVELKMNALERLDVEITKLIKKGEFNKKAVLSSAFDGKLIK